MPEYLTPGVYVEEVSFRAPSIEGVGTTTTGFAGVTLTGPTNTTPELLTSFGDYQNIYGGYNSLAISANTFDPKNVNYMSMAVKAFFDNGGSQLYVSRVFVPKSLADQGIASSGTASSSNVTVSARFPGANGNQTVTVRLKSAKTQNVASLPPGSFVASAPNTSSLASAITSGATQVVLTGPMPGGTPSSIRIDSETMTVTGADPTGTKLTVTRGGSPAAHNAGAAVLGQIAFLFAGIDSSVTSLTLTSAGPTTTTTPGPTTTPAPTTTGGTTTAAPTTTPAPTTTAGPAVASKPTGGIPTTIVIDNETFTVLSVDSTGTVVTVATRSGGASHSANAPVFAPITFYTNGTSGTFSNTAGSLPSPTPSGLYVLTMQVAGETAADSPAVFDGLGFDPAHPYYLGTVLGSTPPRHIDALQNQIAFAIGSSLTPSTLFSTIFANWGGPGATTATTYTLAGGNDGLEPQSPDYDTALARFTVLEDIAIVGAPGSGIFAASQDIINSLITHVSQQRAYRIAILETPPNQLASDNEQVRAAIDSSYAALYVPWVITPNPLATAGSAIAAEVAVPPTGFMAGIYARNDTQNSVAKAPANEVLLGASRLERDISFAEQGILNPVGINCLRFFPNRGFRVWGARTVSSDPEFMYVNVRRYLLYLEHSIDNSTQWAVFENNGPALWSRVKEAIDSFLYNEFVEGNLLGDSPAQAFFVRCDRTTMTQNDLDNGRMICLIGVSVLKPAEFVIFRIGQWTATAQS
jgi:phage tail sheath protein FI